MKLLVEVRPYRADDWSSLWPLLMEMGRADDVARAAARSEELAASGDHYLAVAVIDERVVGYAWAQDFGPHLRTSERTARLHDLFTHPSRRRRGVGRALFEAVQGWAELRGVRWLQWQASPDALPFYAHLGMDGDPCPDRDHPFFELVLDDTAASREPDGPVPPN